MTKALVNAIKKRNYYFKKSKQTGDEAAFLKYKQLRNKVVKCLREAKQSFFSGLRPSNKQFWKTLRQINTTKTSIATCSQFLLLNNYFSDCFNIRVPPLSSSDLCHLSPSLCPEHLLTNESEVNGLFVGIDVTKSTGPDEITGRMIKNTAHSIAPAVTAIFNQS